MNKKMDNSDTAEVGAYIKQLAKDRDVPIKDVAGAIGISPSYLSEVITGKKRPSPNLLSLLADFFQVSRVEVYNAAGWVSFDTDDRVVIQFKEMTKRDPNLLELFDILINLPESERRRIVRFLVQLTKDRAEETPGLDGKAD